MRRVLQARHCEEGVTGLRRVLRAWHCEEVVTGLAL